MKRKHLSHAIGCVLMSAMMTPLVLLSGNSTSADGRRSGRLINNSHFTNNRAGAPGANILDRAIRPLDQDINQPFLDNIGAGAFGALLHDNIAGLEGSVTV